MAPAIPPESLDPCALRTSWENLWRSADDGPFPAPTATSEDPSVQAARPPQLREEPTNPRRCECPSVVKVSTNSTGTRRASRGSFPMRKPSSPCGITVTPAKPCAAQTAAWGFPGDGDVGLKPHFRCNSFQIVRDFFRRAKEFFAACQVEHHRIRKILLLAPFSILDARRNRPRAVEKRRMRRRFL